MNAQMLKLLSTLAMVLVSTNSRAADILPLPAEIVNGKTYPGAMCRPDNRSAFWPAFHSGGQTISNFSSPSGGWVDCPVVRDVLAGKVDALWAASMKVKDPHSTQNDDETGASVIAQAATGTRTARLTTARLRAVFSALLDTEVMVDTTKTAPPVAGDPVTTCRRRWPADYQQARQDCLEIAPSRRAACLRQVDLDFPPATECTTTTPNAYSYVDWGGLLSLEPFPLNVHTIVKNTKLGVFDFDINQVHGTVTLPDPNGDFDAKFVGTIGPVHCVDCGSETFVPTVSLMMFLKLTSNDPTIICRRSVTGCPDIELTNMRVNVELSGFAPTADQHGIGYATAPSSFTFDRNLNNVPDALITLFKDVDGTIRKKVTGKVTKAFEKEAIRERLGGLLTGELEKEAMKDWAVWRGFKKIRRVYYQSRALVIEYESDSIANRSPRRLQSSESSSVLVPAL